MDVLQPAQVRQFPFELRCDHDHATFSTTKLLFAQLKTCARSGSESCSPCLLFVPHLPCAVGRPGLEPGHDGGSCITAVAAGIQQEGVMLQFASCSWVSVSVFASEATLPSGHGPAAVGPAAQGPEADP